MSESTTSHSRNHDGSTFDMARRSNESHECEPSSHSSPVSDSISLPFASDGALPRSTEALSTRRQRSDVDIHRPPPFDDSGNDGDPSPFVAWIKFICRYDADNMIYSCRIAVAMFAAGLFTLVNPGNFVFPQTPWILASAAVVAWQNSLDTATAVKRAIERTAGTAIGALFGLAIGFLSLPLQDSKPAQASLLGFTTVTFCFLMPYLTANAGFRGSYAARLCLVAYAIVSLSFYTSNEPCHASGWYMGVWRAIDILLGCFIGAAALVICPRSTKSVILKRVKNQVKTVGESSCKVLEAASDSFTNHRKLPHWDVLFMKDGTSPAPILESDPAYEAYIKGAHGWKDCGELFSMLKYDHTLLTTTKEETRQFQYYMTVISHRVFRMHTNLVVLASIVRGAAASVNGDDHANQKMFDSMREIGRRIQDLLDPTRSREDRDLTFRSLLGHDLDMIGQLVSQEQEVSVRKRRDARSEGHMDETLRYLQCLLLSKFEVGTREQSPLELMDSHQQVSLFLLLVEQLIIRAISLYQLLSPELYEN